MVNYKYILAAGAAVLLPASVAADVCGVLPTCEALGFTYTADDCGTLKKLKCPFGDAYFCSGNNCKSVSVGSTEKCTEYCAEDSNVCVAKRDMTCSELLSANNCTRKNNGTTLSGTISKDICVFGTVTGSSVTFTQVNVWDAGKRFPACESEMTGRAKLDLSSASITNYASFYTDLDLDYIYYSPQGTTYNWNAYFYGNTNIRVNWQSSTTWTGTLSLYFNGDYYTDEATTNKVVVDCVASSSSSWTPSSCDVEIYSYYANVNYCGWVDSSSGMCYDGSSSSGTCYGEVNINCENEVSGDGSCTNDNEYGYCDTYW